eukprot:1068200-Ditylum_brightwellii.AAC.2
MKKNNSLSMQVNTLCARIENMERTTNVSNPSTYKVQIRKGEKALTTTRASSPQEELHKKRHKSFKN